MGTPRERLANWDLLRSVAMFMVVAVHVLGRLFELGPIPGLSYDVMWRLLILCDPVFFMLSGFFAARPSSKSLRDYYLNKVGTIIIPLVLYSLLLYLWTHRSAPMNVADYLRFFSDELGGPWWFIPELIPCLIVAPFFAKGLNLLKDATVAKLGLVILILYGAGATLSWGEWLFELWGIETLRYACKTAQLLVTPGLWLGYPAYFQFFIAGGILGRLLGTPAMRGERAIIGLGVAAFALDCTFTTLGIPMPDPSYFWLFSSAAIMVACSHLRITSEAAKRVTSWTGQRSYSIYLVQFEVMGALAARLYAPAAFGSLAEGDYLMRVVAWVTLLLGTYLLSLAVASLCDTVLLSNLQRLFRRVVGLGKGRAPQAS